ncbi:phosphoenolpyruvate synthase [sulfur-oxidizing endosymbiont of Gigantopelta aegis]|uniref:phosphoenolpyruvate synthase n=1 Tax=sulfur-oxidizing endosymbiont of Gigantopelta aegis TaxID=2794934 RepID=UPI0018DB6D0A|nr:phosphoenolpyruvate synthase [sulfur-oxidizing endosymbiont of Gigantopelta aegis]
MTSNIIWFKALANTDVDQVGGKNASLGEMISQLSQMGIRVPDGFATTAEAFRRFLKHNSLEQKITTILNELDVDDVERLQKTGAMIRQWIVEAPLPADLQADIITAWEQMNAWDNDQLSVAVRSSATAEDLPDASFAGQQETYLNVRGIDAVLHYIREVYASLYNDRAIAYRVHQNFSHSEVALSAGIQQMVSSDRGASGVMFTLDTESGFKEVVFITAAYGLGETVVQGSVNPDEYYLYKSALKNNKPAILSRTLGSKAIKMIYSEQANETTTIIPVEKSLQQQFCLNDEQLHDLARQAVIIEQHYQRPMDIEWALDHHGQFYIVQARPETVASQEKVHQTQRYQLTQPSQPSQLSQNRKPILTGRAIGKKIGAGKTRVINDVSAMDQVQAGDVLVTDMTDPDWEPVMKRAAAIVTNRGGRTCHAAIIARELGIPAIVGCGNATQVIKPDQDVTVSCAEGDTGNVYSGILDFEIITSDNMHMPVLANKMMLNVGNPSRAFDFSSIPNDGVGLARLEFIINNTIGIHPRALLEFNQQNPDIQKDIMLRIAGYKDPVSFYVNKLIEGISTICAAFAPKQVIIRLSDFKSNEYANMLGGSRYEPEEENPMLGFRGASRYISQDFRACFELECKALKTVYYDMDFNNLTIMVPFVRTLEEAETIVHLLAENGLQRGKDGLKIIMMCEIPSNAILAEEFLEFFDGFSIGSNDMTQLILGLDRDSGLVSHLFNEQNPAIKKLLKGVIETCRKHNKYVGICGQGPSDFPEFAAWLAKQGISSTSLTPDSVVQTWLYLGKQKSQ